MSVGHFDFQDFLPPPLQRKCPQKCPLFNVHTKCPQVFEFEQLMSALFENPHMKLNVPQVFEQSVVSAV